MRQKQGRYVEVEGLEEGSGALVRLEKLHRKNWILSDGHGAVAGFEIVLRRFDRRGHAIEENECRRAAAIGRNKTPLRSKARIDHCRRGEVIFSGVDYRSPAPQHPLFRRAPGESNARAEIVVIEIMRVLAQAVPTGPRQHTRASTDRID